MPWPLGRAIAFLQLAVIPTVYEEAVRTLRDARLVTVPYTRPPPVSDGRMHTQMYATGNKLIDNVLLKENSDPMRHVRDASRLRFPEPSFDQPLDPELVAVVDVMMAAGCELAALRTDQCALLKRVALSLVPFNDHILPGCAGMAVTI